MNTNDLNTLSVTDLEALLEKTQNALFEARRQQAEAALRKAGEEAAKRLAEAPRSRFFTATKELRREGVKWHTNVRQCCRGCVTHDQIGLTSEDDETTPYAWTFGGQGSALRWNHETGYGLRETSYVDDEPILVYVNHGNGAAPKVVEAFRRNGFTVEWDGSDSKCVVIKVPVR